MSDSAKMDSHPARTPVAPDAPRLRTDRSRVQVPYRISAHVRQRLRGRWKVPIVLKTVIDHNLIAYIRQRFDRGRLSLNGPLNPLVVGLDLLPRTTGQRIDRRSGH